MNKRINDLTQKLQSNQMTNNVIRDELQTEYDRYFSSLKTLDRELTRAESSTEYQFDDSGEIESWYRVSMLSDFESCREYFEAYLGDKGFRVDWKNSCLLYSQGESLTIRADHGRANGVWLSRKCIIDESDYKTDGEIDETERNRLIHAWMEKNEYFPAVFRVSGHGDVFPEMIG